MNSWMFSNKVVRAKLEENQQLLLLSARKFWGTTRNVIGAKTTVFTKINNYRRVSEDHINQNIEE